MQVGPYMMQDDGGRLFHWCPACDDFHALPSDTGRWSYNNEPNLPSFSPSFRQIGVKQLPDGQRKDCHYFITDGNIHWCSDSWHSKSHVEPMVIVDSLSKEKLEDWVSFM